MDIKLFQPEEPVSRKAANERLTAINEAGAADIPYDNTTSKMDADNVQRAIDLTAQSAREAVDKINQLIGNDGIVNLTVTLSTGKPASKLPLKVVSGTRTEIVTTNEAGKVTITIKGGGSATVSLTEDYYDITAKKTLSAISGSVSNETMEVQCLNYVAIRSSITKKISELCTRIDVCVVGAGGGGGSGNCLSDSQTGGGGGGGATIIKNHAEALLAQDRTVTISVGRGGDGGRGDGNQDGVDGGSTIANLGQRSLEAGGGQYGSANRGNGGICDLKDEEFSGKRGGVGGNGVTFMNDTNGKDGSQSCTYFTGFVEEGPCSYGGGSGAGADNGNSYSGGNSALGVSGVGIGGDVSSSSLTTGRDATLVGSGGGGGAIRGFYDYGWRLESSNGGRGADGGVFFRFWHGEG